MENPVGNLIYYLLQSRPLADKFYVILYSPRGYNAQFLLRRFLELRWTPQFVMDGTKILRMVVKLHFLNSVNFLPMSLKRMPNQFDLSCKKGYYPT